MTRIVRTAYRYQRLPRKRQAVALEVPAVVKISEKTRRKVSHEPKAATSSHDATTLATETAATIATRAPAATGDRKPAAELPTAGKHKPSAIVTGRPGKRYVDVPDMTPEEHQRRGAAAEALFRAVLRRIQRLP
jgi:hypothetical protein